MLVFHGGDSEIKTPNIVSSKNIRDFGPGFYCTVIREQAEKWAMRYATPVINTYHILFQENLKILEFKTMTDEWLDFIVSCRMGKSHDYDIVIGAMANDQVYNYVADFMDGVIDREQFWTLARFKYPTHQINFCTKRALESLHFVSSEGISL